MQSLLIPFLIPLYGCNSDNKDSAEASTVEESTAARTAWAEQHLQKMNEIVNKTEVFQQLNTLESDVIQIEKDLLLGWAKEWKNKTTSSFARSLSGTGLNWMSPAQLQRTMDGIAEYTWTPATTTTDNAAEYLAQFDSISDVQIDVYDAKRTAKGLEVSIMLDVRGTANQQLRQDRGYLDLILQSTDGEWEITSISAQKMESLRAQRAPIFKDATTSWDLDKLPMYDRQEAIRRGGYALAVVDYDSDGLSDILVGHYGPLQLLKNTGTSFVDVTEKSGIENDGVVKSAAIADLDGDGDRDIIVLRFVEDANDPLGDFVAYENMGADASPQFKRHLDLLPRRTQYDRAMPLTLADFNQDGTLDIYIGFPGIRDFTSGIATRERPEWQASQGIWFNKGDWKFEESTPKQGIVGENNVYAHAALASDLNGDGVPELLVVDDSGRINPIYQQKDGKFINISMEAGLRSTGMSMGLSTADFNGDGHLDIMATNVTMLAGERLFNEASHLSFTDARYETNFSNLREGYKSLLLYANNGDGTFTEVTEQANLSWAGQAAAAGEWIDYNHDGLLDYYLPNGLWTSGPEKLDSLFFRSDIATFTDPLHTGIKSRGEMNNDISPNDVHGSTNFSTPQEDANPVLKLLRSYRGQDGKLKYSLAGSQHNSLFRNNGDGTFTEVGYLEGADRIEDGYIVAPADINNDGRQDLVLRNTDPAPGISYKPVIVLENQQANAKTVRLTFSGNRNVFGALVKATVNGKTLTREIRAVNGAVQAEPVAMFGLNGMETAQNVEIIWQNGERQILGDLQAGNHMVSTAN